MPNELLTPMTELDAVNELLMGIGQAPVSTLANSSIQDVNIARSILARMTRRVQLHGFNFNSDYAYPLAPDVEGVVVIPTGALRTDPINRAKISVRRHPTKGLALWDNLAFDWIFTEEILCDIVWGFGFEDLPETARNYITVAASRRFQVQTIGASTPDKYSAQDEQEAWTQLIREERAARDTNFFKSNRRALGFGQRDF
jgi:hypothetical protein